MPDTLRGGPGHDLADGWQDDDTCVAERTVHCESRRPVRDEEISSSARAVARAAAVAS
jgi:hypothetical protein